MQHNLTFSGQHGRLRHSLAERVLLAGVISWLLFVIAPYCQGLIANAAGTPAAIELIAGAAADLPHPCGAKVGTGPCRLVFSAPPKKADYGGGTNRLDVPAALIAAVDPPAAVQATPLTLSNPPSDLPPYGTPLYLRHQRFLI